jgi:hypothetical protein
MLKGRNKVHRLHGFFVSKVFIICENMVAGERYGIFGKERDEVWSINEL